MKVTVSVDIDTASLTGFTDRHLASLWHVTQANPAPIEDRAAGEVAEHVGREIIRRFIEQAGPELWAHQGRHADFWALHLVKEGTPANPSQPEDESWLCIGQRCEWQDGFGRWWPVTITTTHPPTYSAQLDDGTEAERFPACRFRAVAAQAGES